MADQRAPLNERQCEVLRWISDGCPADSTDVVSRKHTARALAGRHLAEVSRPGGVWTATLTDSGQYYLEHGRHQASVPVAGITRPKRASNAVRAAKRLGPRRTDDSRGSAEGLSSPVSPEALLALLERQGGVVQVINPSAQERAAWRRIIHACKQHGHVPDGWHLVHRGRDVGDLVIELRQGAHPFRRYTSDPKPIPVPARLTRPHRVTAALCEQPDRLPATPENRSRCLLIVNALAREAERRGHRAQSGIGSALLVITVTGVAFSVVVNEETTRRYTARLVLGLSGPGKGTKRWADQAKVSLEHQLVGVMDEVSRRGPLVRQERQACRRHDEQLAEAQRQRAKQERRREITAHRAEILRREVQQWREAEEIRAHCTDLESAGLDPGDQWLRWARDYADTIDPALNPHGLPKPPTDREIRQRRLTEQQPTRSLVDTLSDTPRPWHPNRRWQH